MTSTSNPQNKASTVNVNGYDKPEIFFSSFNKNR
jgi:hypothetical protein